MRLTVVRHPHPCISVPGVHGFGRTWAPSPTPADAAAAASAASAAAAAASAAASAATSFEGVDFPLETFVLPTRSYNIVYRGFSPSERNP